MTQRTQVLIVGELGWPLLDDGRPSNKLSRATALGIPIVSERRFLEWVGRSPSDNDQKTFSADQLAALTKMSSGMIQELAQLSLFDERDGRFGFRDLASARQIAKLLNDGFACRKSFAPSAQSGNGFPTSDWLRSGCMQASSATFRSSNLAAVPTSTASSCSPLMAQGTIPMSCSIGRILPSRLGILPKPKGSIVCS